MNGRVGQSIGVGRRRAWLVGGTVAAAAVVGVFVLSGLAAALSAPQAGAAFTDPNYICTMDTSLSLAVAAPAGNLGPHLVLHVSWQVVNDEDSGFAGYWAMDSYTSTVWVWQLSHPVTVSSVTYNYYWAHTYSGLFQVPQGALSPGETGSTPNAVTQPTPAYGTMLGGDWGYIASAETFTPGAHATHGSLGLMNYGGTTADLLLGTYGNGQVGASTPYSWYTTYFAPADPSYANFIYGDGGNAWGFVYTLNHAFYANPHGPLTATDQWCNFGTGAWGDIVPNA